MVWEVMTISLTASGVRLWGAGVRVGKDSERETVRERVRLKG